MSRVTLRPFAAAALAAILAVTAVPAVHALPAGDGQVLTAASGLWEQLSSWIGGLFAVGGSESEAGPDMDPNGPPQAGPHMDPNGLAAGPDMDPDGTEADAGPEMDPDG